jgi:hypothetical protein
VRVWIAVLRVFGYLWLITAGLLIAFGIVGVWMKTGFSGVQELLSPFNLLGSDSPQLAA